MDTETYVSLGLHRTFRQAQGNATVNGRSNDEIMQALATPADVQYNPCQEAYPSDEIPQGKVTRLKDWRDSAVYAETQRDIWFYVPAGLEAGATAGVCYFNDGAGYLDRHGAVRATQVLDTMIATGAIPPKVGLFVMPGRPLDIDNVPTEGRPPARAMEQRSIEYDSMDDRFASFAVDEMLPLLTAQTGINVSSDPADNLACGISSGGICAFTMAWHRADVFGRVLSHCGSFTHIRGGDNYHYLIRSTARKPIRVFMTSGELDADIILGSWPLANQTVAAALEYAGYDHRFEFGQGGHNLRHGGALFSESLQWLFRQ